MKSNLTQKNIPKDWAMMQLADLCSIKKGEQLNRSELTDVGDYLALNGGIYPSGFTDKWNTEANMITISEGGNSCGYVNFITTKFWCGGHCYALRQVKEKVNNKFLYQVLKSQQGSLMKLRVGSGLPNIQRRGLEEYKVIVPPLPEQQKIAKILLSVDEEMQKTDEIIVSTEKLKKGLMQQLFTRGIGHSKFKETKIGQIPEEWDVVRGTDISVLITKGSSPKWQGFEYQDDGMIFVTSENVRDGYLDLSVTKFLPLEFYNKLKNSQLKKGDILINIVGASIARSCLYDGSFEYANINQAVCLLRVKSSVCQQYILQYLQSVEVINRLLGSQGGSARANLSLSDIRNFYFALPKYEEQKEIAEILFTVDEKISVNKKLKEKLILLKKGLMQDLLSGAKRVKI
jgi:type I restriction enzyme, S subunit